MTLKGKLLLCCSVSLLFILGCNNASKQITHAQELSKEALEIEALIASDTVSSTTKKDYKQNLDKAIEKLNRSEDIDNASNYYNQIALRLYKLKDTAQFRKVNRLALESASKLSDTLELAFAHWDIAHYFHNNNRFMDSAYYHYAESERYFGIIGDSFKQALILRNMASVQSRVKDYVGGESNILKAIQLLKPLDSVQELYRCYMTLGILAMNLENHQEALEYHAEALEYLRQHPEKAKWLPHSLNNLGMVYSELGEYKRASEFFEQVISDPKVRESDIGMYARALNNKGECLLKMEGKYMDPDIFYYAIEIQDSIGDLAGLAKANYNLAEFHSIRGDTTRALEYAFLARENALLSDNNDRMLETLKLLSQLDRENAGTYSEEYYALNESLLLDERRIQNKFGRIEFRTDEFIAQNELLARQRALLIWVVIGLTLLAVAVFIIVQQGLRNQKLRNQQQQQAANQEIFELMLSQNQKKEEGKKHAQKRISEELHDGILGQINGIRMLLIGLNNKADDTAVKLRSDAIHKLQEVQEEIRSLSHELNHAALQKVNNFINSLHKLLEQTAVPAGLRYSFNYSKDFNWDNLNSDYKINLYRITQEVVQNTIKHAGATTIFVELSTPNDQLRLKISDDGRGFKAKSGKMGIGHRNIASRVEQLGGKWKIKSKIGKGTTVLIFLPFNPPSDSDEDIRKTDKVFEKA